MNRIVTTALLLAALATGAMAQDSTTVAIPVGEWADALLPTAGALFMAAVGWGFRKLPATVLNIFRTFQVEQMLEKAKDFGIATTKGATKDMVLEINVGNAVVAQGVTYVMKYAPAWMKTWLDGASGVHDRLVSRIDVEAQAGTEPAVILQSAAPHA